MTTLRLTDKKPENLRKEYLFRINRVMDYIEENLEKELSLEILSHIACFSPYHFHRIFRAMVGETLNQFIQRIRLEKAALQLIYNPDKSITEIAMDCGFSSSATFARAFKESFQMSASKWRLKELSKDRKICKTDRKNGQPIGKIRQDIFFSSCYSDAVTKNLVWRIEMKDKKQIRIEVKEMPEFQVAYIRHIGPYKNDSKLFESLFEKLSKWAGPRGLLRFPETKVIAAYHDDPQITDENKLRISACITVPEDTPAEGEIGRMVIPGGTFAVAHFELAKSEEYEEAWNMVYGGWLPESGYQPDDRLCYESYLNNPKEHPEKIHIVDIYVPVKPL